MRCFRIYLREKAKLEITTESSHCGVRADGRTGYSSLKGREYTAGTSIFGDVIWYKLPKTVDLTELDDRWRTAICWRSRIEVMNTSSAWGLEQYSHDQFDGRSRASDERKSAEDGHRHTMEPSARRSGGATEGTSREI